MSQSPHTSPADPLKTSRYDPWSYEVSALLPWVPVHAHPCVSSRSGAAVSPSPVALLHSSPTGLQSQVLWGLFLLMPDPQAGEPDVGLSPTGELLRYNCSPVCGSPTWGVWDLIILSVRPSYHLVGFLHVFGCINRISFLVGLRLFY